MIDLHRHEQEIHDMYWLEDMNTTEIAKVFGVGSSTIYRFMKKNGIKIRTKQESLQRLKILNTGRRHTKESKRNMSAGIKASYDDIALREQRTLDNIRVWADMSDEDKKKRYLPGLRAAQLNAQKINVSSIEIKIKDELEKLGISHIHQLPVKDGKFILDFYLPEYKLVVECNGDYWHQLPERIKRDKDLEEYVLSTGREIVFIWEHEINANSEKALHKALKGVVRC